jgi:hypothetical protein
MSIHELDPPADRLTFPKFTPLRSYDIVFAPTSEGLLVVCPIGFVWEGLTMLAVPDPELPPRFAWLAADVVALILWTWDLIE